MTTATLGFAIESSQAVTAKANLDRMSQAAATAEAAQQKLAGASSVANAALARIASGVDQANIALAKLVKLTEENRTSTVRMDAAKQSLAKTTVQEARASEGAAAAARQETAANDRLTESVNRQAAAIAASARARAAAGLDAWGRTPAEVASHVAATKASPAVPVAAIPVSANTQAELVKAEAITRTASEGARATGMLSAGLMSALVPANLLSFALFSLSGAAIEWAHSMLTGASQAEKVLEKHKALVDAIAKSYPAAAEAAKRYEEQAGKLPQPVVQADIVTQQKTEREAFKSQMDYLQSQMGPLATGRFGSLLDDATVKRLNELAAGIQSTALGAADVQKRLGELRLDPSITPTAKALLDALQATANTAKDLEASLKGSGAAMKAITGFNGPGGLPIYLDPARGASDRYMAISEERTQLARMQRSQEAELAGINARSPEERRNAARLRAEATVNNGETPAARNFRIESAGAVAYAQALRQITDAQESRVRAMNQGLAQQQLELSLIGKTTGEAAKLRFEFEHIQQLREDAARNHTIVDPAEIDLIKQAAEETGKYVDALARANLAKDLAFEHDQLRRSTQDAAVAAMQRGAGLPIDLASPEAQQMRANMEFSEAKDIAKNFLTTFENMLVSSGGDVGKAMGAAILSALMNSMTKQWEAIFDKAAIMFASAITGQKGGAGTGAAAVGSILGGANDNYAPGAITRAALPDIGSFASAGFTKTGIPLSSISAQGLGAKVNAAYADRFQGLLNDLTAAGYPITSLGEGGYSYRTVAGSKNLSNHAFGNAIDINPRQNPWAVGAKGNFAQYGIDPNELAQRNGLFWGGNWNKSDAMHFQVDKASKALDKLSTSSIGTAQSLSGGLGKLGNALNQFPAAPGGGGGGLLGSLFGGLSSAFAGSSAFSWLSANPGGYIGLYAEGTENAPPGWAWVGERGPELRKLRSGDVIRSNPRSTEMVANMNGQSRPAEKIDLHVNVYGGSGDDHVRMLAEQGARKVVGEYNRGQVSGGFGTTQKRYNSMKG
ncbi:M15 family metallopeptidase [Aquamicrobium soli]|uniref:M15 family metallopeptidase n=1 Tax=Aquamicrobium soli TaxID=1811518 RepID=A0ABV7KD90_9HYPH